MVDDITEVEDSKIESANAWVVMHEAWTQLGLRWDDTVTPKDLKNAFCAQMRSLKLLKEALE